MIKYSKLKTFYQPNVEVVNESEMLIKNYAGDHFKTTLGRNLKCKKELHKYKIWETANHQYIKETVILSEYPISPAFPLNLQNPKIYPIYSKYSELETQSDCDNLYINVPGCAGLLNEHHNSAVKLYTNLSNLMYLFSINMAHRFNVPNFKLTKNMMTSMTELYTFIESMKNDETIWNDDYVKHCIDTLCNYGYHDDLHTSTKEDVELMIQGMLEDHTFNINYEDSPHWTLGSKSADLKKYSGMLQPLPDVNYGKIVAHAPQVSKLAIVDVAEYLLSLNMTNVQITYSNKTQQSDLTSTHVLTGATYAPEDAMSIKQIIHSLMRHTYGEGLQSYTVMKDHNDIITIGAVQHNGEPILHQMDMVLCALSSDSLVDTSTITMI